MKRAKPADKPLRGLSGRLVLLGAGKMGSAMLEGWLARGLDPRKLAVLEPHPTKAIQTLARRGVTINPRKKIFEASAVVIAVKPQNAPEAMPTLEPFVGKSTLALSIMAGRAPDGFLLYEALTAAGDGLPPRPQVVGLSVDMPPEDALATVVDSPYTRYPVYRVSLDGHVEIFQDGFGRPQGLAFDDQGHLYVVDAVAGASGVYRLRIDRKEPLRQMIAGGDLIGLAFDPRGGLVLVSQDTAYRLNVPLRGLLWASRA